MRVVVGVGCVCVSTLSVSLRMDVCFNTFFAHVCVGVCVCARVCGGPEGFATYGCNKRDIRVEITGNGGPT